MVVEQWNSSGCPLRVPALRRKVGTHEVVTADTLIVGFTAGSSPHVAAAVPETVAAAVPEVSSPGTSVVSVASLPPAVTIPPRPVTPEEPTNTTEAAPAASEKE